MHVRELIVIILEAWRDVAFYIADGHENEFLGKGKETIVFRKLRGNIIRANPSVKLIGPDIQERFKEWHIDLVCIGDEGKIAIEGKYKIIGDGAVPDNRKAAFFDLFKLEQYVFSGEYSMGLFLWLTNELGYLRGASGDLIDFSTHKGRIYEPGRELVAKRARTSGMPIPLRLKGKYVFNWQKIIPNEKWHSLVLEIE